MSRCFFMFYQGGLGQDSPEPSDPSGSRCSRWAAQLKAEWPGEKKTVHQVWWNVEIPQGDLSLTVVLDGYIHAYWWLYWCLLMVILMVIDDYWWLLTYWWWLMVIHGYIDWIWMLIHGYIDGYWFNIGMVQVERTQASSKELHCRNRDLSSFEVQAGWGGCGGLFNLEKHAMFFLIYILYIYIYININVTHTHIIIYIYKYYKYKWTTHTHIYTYIYYIIKSTGNGQYIM